MRYCILGEVRAFDGEGRPLDLGGRRQRMVLALLLLHAGAPITVDRLIEGVWGGQPPPSARKTLQVYVARLRRLFGGGRLTPAPGGYRLHLGADELDARRFERLAAEGRGLLSQEPARASQVLSEALELWQGTPWGELGDEPALVADATRLRDLRLGVVEDRVAAELAVGTTRPLVGELQLLVAEHPLRERVRGLLMAALAREDRTAEALEVFEQGRALLAEELGVDPGPELQDLHRRILQHDPALLSPAPTAAPVTPESTPLQNPYKGLRPFGEDDAPDLFGRDRLLEELSGRLLSTPLLALAGPSGSGKSSTLRAGLVPAVRTGALATSARWRIATMQPGTHPFTQLQAALQAAVRQQPPLDLSPQLVGDDLDLLRAALRVVPEDDQRLLLVIDQFEELYLQVSHDEERDRFLHNLVEVLEDPHSRCTVVLAIRTDLLDRPMAHTRLGAHVVDGLVHVLPLAPAELEAACTGPARRVGVQLEPELVAELAAEAADHPGALPLLQYTLTELFDRRVEQRLTLHAYRELGGIQGLVGRRAEETFATLDEGAQTTCRQVFLRLVVLGEEGEIGHRRVDRDDLDSLTAGPGVVGTILDRFATARLLVLDREPASGHATVQMAHESLLRAWPRLGRWIDDSQDDLRLQRWLSMAAADWAEAGHDDDYLLTGARLDLAQEWRARGSAAATQREHAFIDASLTRRERERAEAESQQQRELALERRAGIRLRALVAVLALAALVAGGLGVVASAQRSRAEEQAAAARAATELVRARQLVSAAIETRQVDPDLSLLLALHAANISTQAGLELPPEQVEALHWALQAARVPFPGDLDGLAVTGPEGPRGIFPITVPELVAMAQDHVQRDLTRAECDAYLGPANTCPTLPNDLTVLGGPPTGGADPAETSAPLDGTEVTFSIPMSLPPGLSAELEAFENETGIEIAAFADIDLLGRLNDAIEDGRPPDLALVPQPSVVADLGADGELIDLARSLDLSQVRAAFAPHLVGLGTVAEDGAWPAADGGLYGLPLRLSNKSVIWYASPLFDERGYEVPASYDQLVQLSERMAADGLTPWCHGEGAGATSGWPGTDLIENLLLHDSLVAYDAWLEHDIGFDSPPLRRAFERFARLLLQPGHLAGGQRTAAVLQYDAAAAPLISDPPGCGLFTAGTDALGWLPFDTQFGVELNAFPFPPIDPDTDPAVLGAGDYLVQLTDRPEVRAAVRFLTGDQYGRQAAALDPQYISPRTDFPTAAYLRCEPGEPDTCAPDPIRTELAPELLQALEQDRFRYDGSDLLPYGVGLFPMWSTMVEFVGAGPDNLDDLLTGLDAEWERREAETRESDADRERSD
jgi:DNA-binding SARP family transcriptional activator/ABC-type glycerol-3-phosphate transport system substrate-binding protein